MNPAGGAPWGCPPWGSPLHAPLSPWLAQLPDAPASAGLQCLLAAHPVIDDHGRRLQFNAPVADGLAYETRIARQAIVETRPDNWHDFFNALVWLAFPRSKRAVTRAHEAAMLRPGNTRGGVRDGLTHVDECGIAVLAADPGLLDLLADFRWRELFVERRAEVIHAMRFVVFGHATYDQLRAPFRGLTAKALLFPVASDLLRLDSAGLTDAADALLAERLATEAAAGSLTPRRLHPLPLLGLPGLTAENEDPAYYDDTWQFRPGRRRA